MTDLEWDQSGAGDRVLVWGHGLTSSRRGDASSPLAGLVPAAVDAGWRAVRYDARGHGDSPGPADPDAYRWERLADDMFAVADAAGADRFVAAGASMGAATALYAALASPERIEALVLVVPPTAWATRAAQGEMYEKRATIAEADGLGRLIALSRDLPPTTMFGEAGKARSIENLAAMDPRAFAHVMRGAAASDLPGPDELATIEALVLILAWSGDDGHPVATAETLRQALPHSELHVADTPAEVEEWPDLLTRFLAQLPSG
jgi:3-oxoadipate enol-lactonase